jgi:hypothetical protein
LLPIIESANITNFAEEYRRYDRADTFHGLQQFAHFHIIHNGCHRFLNVANFALIKLKLVK